MRFLRRERLPGCHGSAGPPPAEGGARVLMVGHPNVGKSALFNRLTAAYATVSNYPGTTVEVSRGRMRHGRSSITVIDTPGMYSLLPITEEERVGRSLLMAGDYDLVLHVVDTKNLPRMLPFTLQLIEAGLPVILVLNMMDEAAAAGLSIEVEALSRRLGIPVFPTVSHKGSGVKALKEAIYRGTRAVPFLHLDYGPSIERAAREISRRLPPLAVNPRAAALLALQEDRDTLHSLSAATTEETEKVFSAINAAKRELPHPVHYYLTLERKRKAEQIAETVMGRREARKEGFSRALDRWLLNPWTGIPIVAAVLYLVFYKFVGGFGAGTLVDFLEGHLFRDLLVPEVNRWAERLLPWPPLRELFAGEYGLITLGFRYAVAIVLPIVGCFFLAFALVEDSGYLPRLSYLVDRLFKTIGLSGRAVIPMTLGFGCGTMATLVTRTLETTRERVIATLLLALAVPCSAQMGIIFGLSAARPALLLVWGSVVASVFLLVGFLAARALPGVPPQFFIELPPLRLPRPANVWIKTATRMQWYFAEILPLFLLASVVIWAGRLTRLFDALLWLTAFPVRAIGLPEDAARAFLFGFFRRDYGAAGLYDINRAGLLSGNQLAVALITMTLFLPCVAQFMVMIKERGTRTALAVAGFVFPFAFLAGGAVHLLLRAIGVEI